MVPFSAEVWTCVLCAFVTIAAVVYTYAKWIYRTFKRNGIPYFEPTFPLGNLKLSNEVPISMEMCNTASRAKAKGWNYFGMFAILNPFFVPLELDMIKHILTKDFDHFIDRGFYYNEKDDPISAHLFAIGGQKWKTLRSKVSPTFTAGKLKAMFSTLISGCSILEQKLEEYIKMNEPIDIKTVLSNYTMDSIGSVAFGVECNSFKETETPFKKYTRQMIEKSLFSQMSDLFNENFPNLARSLHRKLVPTQVSKFFFDFVTNTVSYREKNNFTRNDLLQLLINIKNTKGEKSDINKGDGMQLSMDEIVSQSFVFFLGGFETTATTMTFLMYELSTRPEIQEKVREELLGVLKKYDNEVCYDALRELVYMQQVIDETLRRNPALPFITRECIKDYKVPDTDVLLKKGSLVLIPIRSIHYDKSYYENPEEFDPERFSPENKAKRHPYAHIPFGEGPRTCIGMRFAVMQVRLIVTKILSKYRITLNAKTETPLKLDPKSFFVPIAKGGIWLNLEKL